MESRMFHLGDVLTIITGKFICPTGVDGLYDILNFMTNDNLFTHQLPRAAKECKPYLEEMYPELTNISLEHINPSNWENELELLVEEFGEWFKVFPIHYEDHDIIDPIEELKQMKPDIKIIKFDVPPDEPDPYGDINW